MSAPQTNLDKQGRRHRGPLVGMAIVVVFAVGLMFIWLMDESSGGQTPDDTAATPEAAATPVVSNPPSETVPAD